MVLQNRVGFLFFINSISILIQNIKTILFFALHFTYTEEIIAAEIDLCCLVKAILTQLMIKRVDV